MSLQTFFHNFALLTNAPNSVAKLRELILQLAVQGKLIKQNPNDESAEKLFQKISKEKKNAPESLRTKKNDLYSDIDGKAYPFAIPDNWKFVFLGQIVRSISNGFSGKPVKTRSRFPITRIETIAGGYIDFQRVGYVEEIDEEKYRLEQGDILFSHINSVPHLGKTAIYSDNEVLFHGTNLLLLRVFKEFVRPEYFDLIIKYLRQSGAFAAVAQEAINQASINQTKLKSFVIPLAPLEEQKRIVAKVNELMRLCDALEAQQLAKRASRVRLNNATLAPLKNAASLAPKEFDQVSARLADNFDALYDSAETIGRLRSTILQIAVQGKLIPQDTNAESPSGLLKKIKEDRDRLVKSSDLKKLNPQLVLNTENLPSSLPQGWQWIRLGEISQKLGAGSTPLGGKNVYQDSGIKFLRSQNIWNDGLRLDGVAYISEKIHQDMSGTHIEAGDILLNITGASIGRSCIVPEDLGEANVSQHVSIVRLVDKSIRSFVHLCIISPYFQDSIMQTQVGISREGLSMRSLREFVLPIPPVEEQKRIIAKVNQLMTLCDELETKLRQAEADSEKLMKAAVRDLLASITNERPGMGQDKSLTEPAMALSST